MKRRMDMGEWVEAVNAIASTRAAERKAAGLGRVKPMGVEVRVLIRAIYSRPDGKAHGWCEPGQIIRVPGDDYVNGLLAKNMVTLDIEEPVVPVPDEPEATAAARKIAAEWSIDLRKVSGTGSGGKIVKGDVLGFLVDDGVETQEA